MGLLRRRLRDNPGLRSLRLPVGVRGVGVRMEVGIQVAMAMGVGLGLGMGMVVVGLRPMAHGSGPELG